MCVRLLRVRRFFATASWEMSTGSKQQRKSERERDCLGSSYFHDVWALSINYLSIASDFLYKGDLPCFSPSEIFQFGVPIIYAYSCSR